MANRKNELGTFKAVVTGTGVNERGQVRRNFYTVEADGVSAA